MAKKGSAFREENPSSHKTFNMRYVNSNNQKVYRTLGDDKKGCSGLKQIEIKNFMIVDK